MRVWLPLRVKLTLWALAVFLGVHLAVSGGWLAWTRHSAEAALERELEDAARKAVSTILREPQAANDLDALASSLASAQLLRRYAVILRGERGELVSTSSLDPGLQSIEVPAPELARAEEYHFDSLEVVGDDGQVAVLRVVNVMVPDELGRKLRLQLAARTPWPETLGETLLDLVGTSTFFGLFAAGTMAWFLAGRAVAPIQRMARAARAVRPEAITTRLDVDPGNAELVSLQRELNAALARLEEGYRQQGMFISNVSHELKTPIAVLLSQAQVLKQEAREPAELERFVSTVEEEMRTLGRLVESFLVLARASHGEELVRRERSALTDVVVEAAERCAPLARSSGVPLVTKLSLDGGAESVPEIEGDPELLRTMIENLLRNAIRFSPRGASVDLALRCGEREARVIVRDRGPGVAPEWIGRVFEPFVQAPQTNGRGRGSGLGLAIARSVAKSHGGTIDVRNEPDGGACFEIRLPLATALPDGAARA